MFHVLFEDNHLLAFDKPAGIPSAHGEETMLTFAKTYVKNKYQKPGNVYLGVVHRLDKPVSGVLLFARTSKAAARLSEQFRNHEVQKTYIAICEKPHATTRSHGWSYEDHGQMEDYLWHDDQSHIVKVVPANYPGAQQALTEYRILHQSQYCVLQLTPKTGRRHQLRVQLASRGSPILGDRKYGNFAAFDGIALHARSLVVKHPISNEPLILTAPFPKSWVGWALPTV